MQQTFFSQDIKPQIIKMLSEAKKSITVAVAWFTDKQLSEQLINALQNGVEVRLLVLNDEINENGAVDFEELSIKGVKVYFWDKVQHGLMHHKFMVIDSRLVMMGSYNWTFYASSQNQESVIVFEDDKVAQDFLTEFNALIIQSNPSITKELSIQWIDMKGRLRARIKELNFLIATKEAEVTEAQSLLEKFGRIFRQTLAKWLQELYSHQAELSKLIASQSQRRSDQEAYEEDERKNREFKGIIQKDGNTNIPELEETEKLDIKKMYREALMLSHPDKFHNEPEKKQLATEITTKLTIAYKANDVETVRSILESLKSGIAFGLDFINESDEDKLNALLASLEAKLLTLSNQLNNIHLNEDYIVATSQNWEQYFAETEMKIQNQIKVLKTEIEKRKKLI